MNLSVRCIFDRRFSRLPQLPDETLESQQMHGYVEVKYRCISLLSQQELLIFVVV